MKVGVFADVHGNIYAFEKVFRALVRETCDLYCFAGDICGYYYYQSEIIAMLRGMDNLVTVAGNHDRIFLDIVCGRTSGKAYEEKYGRSATLLAETIEARDMAYLEEMPDASVVNEAGVGMFHGSPWDRLNGYVYPDAAIDRFGELPYRYIILGHTHHPMVRRVKNVCVINPGSVGQPRDYSMPSYAVIDTDAGDVSIRRIEYDHSAMMRDVRKRRETCMYLAEVLERGRGVRSA